MKTGLLVGDFAGSIQDDRLLLEFARAYVDTLYILVRPDWQNTSSLSQCVTRVRALAPSAQVFSLDENNLVPKAANATSSNRTTDAVRSMLPSLPDVIIGDDDNSRALALSMGVRCIPLGFNSNQRGNCHKNPTASQLEHAPPHRIAIIGPQSSGKSTLAQQLAEHYGTVWVPEYARIFADHKTIPLERDDVDWIARGQLAAEIALSNLGHRRLFIDTEAIMTSLYSRIYYGDCPTWIDQLAASRPYDLYLLTAPDIPWVADPQRDLPDARDDFFAACHHAIAAKAARCTTIRGDWATRLNTAVAAVESLTKD